MKIREIGSDYAQLLVPHRDPILQFFAVEKAWYASDDDQLLGTVLYHRCSNEWAFLVMGIDERGCFRWIAGDVNLKTQQEATDRMQLEMERIAQTGQTIFERPLKQFFRAARQRRTQRFARRAQRRIQRSTAKRRST